MKSSFLMNHLQVYIISLVLFLNPLAITLSSAVETNAVNTLKAEFISELKQHQDQLNKALDKDELLLNLDFDTNKIIDFMTNEVAYQAYHGVLRGAKGTLIGRAGNSHDQALALSGLLKDAGLETQIVYTTLTDSQAQELNLQISQPSLTPLSNQLPLNKLSALDKYHKKIQDLMQENSSQLSNLKKQLNSTAKNIHNKIPNSSLAKGKQSLLKSVKSSSNSYRWVRYRTSPLDEWKDAHPAYKGAKKWGLKFESYEKETINPKDIQNVSVEVWIENSKGEKHSVSGLWKKPAANLLDHTLTLEFGSDAMANSELWGNQQKLFDQSKFFYLQIDGSMPKEGKVFDLRGNTYPADSLAGLNSIFATVNQKGQKAIDALSGLSFGKKEEKQKSVVHLSKVWLEFTLDGAMKKPKKIERVIFNGDATKNPGKSAMRILQRWDINFATTTPMQQYYQSKKVQAALTSIDQVDRLNVYVKNNPQASQYEVIQKYSKAIGNPNSSTLIHKRVSFDGFENDENTISYISEPNILAIRHGISFKNNLWSVYEMTDIISNQRWSFNLNNSKEIQPNILASIKHGVWQTKMETSKLLPSNNTIYTDSAFSQLTEFEELVAKTNLESGHLQFSNSENKAYWDLDLESGSIIGMADLGHGLGGSEVTEEMLLEYIAWGISGVFFVVGTFVCIEGGGSVACCVSINATLLAAGYSLGVILGASILVGKIAASIIGIGFDLGTTMLPNPCESGS